MRKLSVGLIPLHCWCRNLRDYLPARQWNKIQYKKNISSGQTCEICGERSDELELQTIWSFDAENHIQKLSSIKSACPMCRLVIHFRYAQTQGRADEALTWYMRVNQLSEDQSKAEINESFRFNKYLEFIDDWKLDVNKPYLLSLLGELPVRKGSINDTLTVNHEQRFYLDVPYEDKEQAKAFGAKWDKNASAWYYLEDEDRDTYALWVNGSHKQIVL